MKAKAKAPPALEGVASAERTLSLLSAFRKGDADLSLAELSARTGLVKSTIMRLAISLEACGFLSRTAEGNYRLEAELLRLGMIYQQSFRLEAHVMPLLERLVEQTGESAAFYIRREDQRLCLFRVDSPHRLRMHVRQGDLLPLDTSAIAQVLRLFTTSPLPAEAGQLDFPLFTSGANDPHVAGMAMPVFGPEESFAGALCLTGPITRLTAEAAVLNAPLLRESAAELTRRLGGRMPLMPTPPPAPAASPSQGRRRKAG
ncbi:IclR family transcriptional regulator [Acetobacteraceae bacterium H6797]|nr:IclR family transcriptional regulator [Acetobacteraceae bacterium H6797]